MEKFKIRVLENERMIIEKEGRETDKHYWSTFYNMYLDGERYKRAGVMFYVDLKFEHILNAKSFFLK